MDRRIRYSSSFDQRPSFLSPKRKFAWSNYIIINTLFTRNWNLIVVKWTRKLGGTDVFYWGLSVFVLPCYLLGEYDFMSIHSATGVTSWPVDKLWKIDLDYSECNLSTNNNTLERSFHSTEDPGRSWVKPKFPLYLFFGT